MPVTFYLGRSGSGKTTTMQETIAHRLRENPEGAPIIYLVPEQMTFQSEYKLVKLHGNGMARAQAVSFSRLAWRILQEVGGMSRYHVQRTGVQMLLRKIIEQEKNDLRVFGQASDKSGFIDQVERMMTELKRYDVVASDLESTRSALEEKGEGDPKSRRLADKLHDVALVYEKMETSLAETYVSSEDALPLLAEKITYSEALNGAEVFIDGFHRFTPQELTVIEQLLRKADHVHIALTVDDVYDEQSPHELDTFFMTGTTYQQLKYIAKENDIEIEEPVWFTAGQRFSANGLSHLEAFGDTRPAYTSNDREGVHLLAAVHRRAEVEGISREICRLVREDGYRYRDIAVLVRNANDYADLMETIFRDHNIPLFMDEKRSMLNHPVVEFIRSCMEIVYGNWRYESVFRCFKTDLLFSLEDDREKLREQVDELENYVLAYGIQGKKWHEQKPWTYRRQRTIADGELPKTEEDEAFAQRLNELRELLTAPIRKFERQVKSAKTVQDYAKAVYLLLEGLEVPKKLERMRDEAAEKGDLGRSREHDQVWDAVVDLLDQVVEMAGEETLSFERFRQMIDTGLEGMKFAIVPPAMDQVTVASMERSRLSDIKCTFVIGANDGVIPARPEEDGLFTDDERESLDSDGSWLAPGSTRQLLDESFLVYLAFASPSDRLYITYPLADEEGKSLQPSMYVKRIQDLFPQLTENLLLQDPNEVDEYEQSLFLTSEEKALSSLAYQLQMWQKGYPISSLWWGVYNWFLADERRKQLASQVLGSLFYRNETKRLDPSISRSLYGEHIRTSVSRMETYQSCPFAQFASHGLKLKERDTYKLEAPDIGQLFHAALKEMADHLRTEGKDWAQLSKKECTELAGTIVDQLAPKIQREILLSSNRYHYIKQKLEDVVARASTVLREQAQVSGFSPAGLEVGFGPKEELPPLTFTLSNGCTMSLVGRIDRVDQATSDQGLLLRIIDYKSSAKDMKLQEVYYGLALQMLIYLDVVISFSEDWLGKEASPAGVLYFHVHNPFVQASGTMNADAIEKELMKKFKMKGLLAADTEAVQLMDQSLEQGFSQVIPAALKKDGNLDGRSSVVQPDEFSLLQKYLRNQVKKTGEAITDGDVEISPYKLKQNTPCTYCSFKSVCQFDATLEGNDYRVIAKEDDKDILEKIRQEGRELDGDSSETE
ncbi:helicase-exonuclease AddAB subunit AddB [Texcoconibacillus texcoconensis]|uniref:ATP-dependent helicase/deoxyribonuclease subunit B n=1 Tax=Texcoconibacillus texcoconensis TaxID=1095777 RepID=A0A840QTW4_9BACI|nr:helicase-exonuclease AddAB subunit AddB [Texcoconibacillus texcoconensis]MBB5174707.1 ATP-dependent helicase/nuclease subunit B [Texcoconibacillus texcoconensis]